MTKQTLGFSGIFLSLIAVSLATTASAQLIDDDPFGDREDYDPSAAEEAPSASAAPSQFMDQATQKLFNEDGNAAGNGGFLHNRLPQAPRNTQWEDLSAYGSERIEDTYEMKMRQENNKPLPKRDPFGDRLGEIQNRFKNQPGKATSPGLR